MTEMQGFMPHGEYIRCLYECQMQIMIDIGRSVPIPNFASRRMDRRSSACIGCITSSTGKPCDIACFIGNNMAEDRSYAWNRLQKCYFWRCVLDFMHARLKLFYRRFHRIQLSQEVLYGKTGMGRKQ
ncbi:MAG: hypothetical protein BWX45_00306 [Deltaproteobacteria bacterium ADurb.Bin002]|nr:MAG: hypothetical protein BWX45_00306 [Deltaproteobacteria bacterium ADurb.Bin002]